MRLDYLVIHCTATPEGRPVSSNDIRKWHTSPRSKGGRGWKQVGYSEVIHLDGEIELLVPYNDDNNVDAWEITNGVKGLNRKARHIVYVGGLDKNGRPKDTRTPAQLKTLKMYVKAHTTINSNWLIAGHNQFAAKACPSFDTKAWLKSIGVLDKNIYKK